MDRLPDWDQRLNDFLAEWAGVAQDWSGTRDCVIFADGAVEAQTGESFLGPYRGKWNDEASAKRVIANGARERGAKHATLPAAVDTMLPVIRVGEAHRGDIILTKDGNLAVCWGDVALAVGSPATPGLIRIERADWRRAWQVGERP